MFGHSLNPDYFVNPPAYTYVVHFLYALRWGTDPASIGNAFATDPGTAFVIARVPSAEHPSALLAGAFSYHAWPMNGENAKRVHARWR